ncbi:MAG: S41 family peptidase [Alphaproteobacteria bacterium]|nr:S41 family peptidase [Alphaproteobacteria bacterium]
MRRVVKLAFVSAVMLSVVPVISYAQKNDTLELLTLFGDVFDRVRSDYVEEVKDADIIEAAINGMLSSLDPHSGYMNEKNFQEMQVQTRGEFGGLGIEVTMENGLVKVVSPIDDTPAAKAGVLPGDYVSFIDDEAVMGLSLNEAVDKMRGKVDTKVKLTILREGAVEPIEVTLIRANIKIRSSKGRAEGDDIAYLRLAQFNEKTTEQMREEFARIKKDTPNLRGVVLDLRNNPGGLLDEAISVSDAFLTGGEVVSTRERDPNKTKRYSAKQGDELVPVDMPIVVLVNAGSASASEIVSGALQDHKRAIIMGTKTFGKGSVQTVIPLPEHGAMRLTTARYYTPSGHSIQAKGIEPDIIVEQAKIEPLKQNDKMRMEADLRRRLENLEDKKAQERLKKSGALKKDDDESDKDDKKDDKTDKADKETSADGGDSNQDFQLQRAIDLLRAAHVFNLSSAQ